MIVGGFLHPSWKKMSNSNWIISANRGENDKKHIWHHHLGFFFLFNGEMSQSKKITKGRDRVKISFVEMWIWVKFFFWPGFSWKKGGNSSNFHPKTSMTWGFQMKKLLVFITLRKLLGQLEFGHKKTFPQTRCNDDEKWMSELIPKFAAWQLRTTYAFLG